MSSDGVRGALDTLPDAWSLPGREPITFELPSTGRPWNWLELDRDEAATMWRVLAEFVDYLHARYLERTEQRIPPCWAEHGALVEELTTLFWARWLAFESREATPGSAESFHAYLLPGFLERMAHWLGPDRLRKCQAGKHEPRSAGGDGGHGGDGSFAARRRQIVAADASLRLRSARSPRAPGTGAAIFEDDLLEQLGQRQGFVGELGEPGVAGGTSEAGEREDLL